MEVDEINIRGLFGVIRRQAKLIAMTVIVIMAAAFIYVYTLTPMYSASTLILVDPADKNLLATEMSFQNSNLNNVRVDGEIVILKSDAVALLMVQAADLMADPEFGIGTEADTADPSSAILLKTVIQNIQDATRVTRQGATYLISASITAQSPARAAELTNVLAEAYISNQIATKVNSIEKVAAILRSRLSEARQALEVSESAFNDFITENMDMIESETGRSDLAALNAAFSAIKAQSVQKELRLRALERGQERQDWAGIAETLQTEVILSLDRQRAAAAQQLETVENGTQASIDLRRELARIDQELTRETTTAVQNLRAEVSGLRAQIGDTQARIRQTVLGGDLPPALLTKIYELQQSASITRAQYDTFLTRLRDVELQAELQVADARIVSPALPPLKPSSKSKRIILLFAGIIALVLGVGLAFLNEFFIGGFTSEAQLANGLQLPVAARIPAVTPIVPAARSLAEPSVAQIYVDQPMSAYAESIRRLRVGLDQSLRWRNEVAASDIKSGKVVMMTSTLPGEGKSNTALALGRAYADSGLRTALIDCDLRFPRLHRIMGVETNSAMLEYLTDGQDDSDFANMYQQDFASTLEVMVGAGRSNVPTDQLLVGPRFSQLVRNAREKFDIVILDAPPLLPLVDGLYLAHYADVITLMVKWASTTQQDVRSVLPALFDAKKETVEVLGVLGQERSGKLGYYRKYASYYGYHEAGDGA